MVPESPTGRKKTKKGNGSPKHSICEYLTKFDVLSVSPMTTRTIHWNFSPMSAVRKKTAHSAGARTSPPQKMRTSDADSMCWESPFLASNTHSDLPSSLM